MKRPSIRELSEKLGVDRATISRALSTDKTHLVAPATRERIRREAAAVGYRPDLMAATLRRGRSNTVGILVSNLMNEVLVRVTREIIAGLNPTSEEGGITPLIGETASNAETTRHLLHLFLSRRVDAVISLAATQEERDALVDAADEVPVVLAVRSLSTTEFPSAICDDAAGGRMAANHLAARGHRLVCQIKGPQVASTYRGRAEGFSAACAKAGLIEVPPQIVTSAALSSQGKSALEAILAAPIRPTAVFAHNDSLALGLIEAMRQHGMAYPDDLSIIGFNNFEISKVLARPLTTIEYPVEGVGRHAAQLVRALTADKDFSWQTGVFTPTLVERASVKTL